LYVTSLLIIVDISYLDRAASWVRLKMKSKDWNVISLRYYYDTFINLNCKVFHLLTLLLSHFC
jgi:hypothetical protein